MPRRSRAMRDAGTEEVDCADEVEKLCAGRKLVPKPPRKVTSAAHRTIREHFMLTVNLHRNCLISLQER
jgi:hypothetical protein